MSISSAAMDSLPGSHEPEDSSTSGKATWRDYVGLTKVGITVANLMAAFAGLWVASYGHPNLIITLFTLLGTALVVAGGAALNNFVDRDIDHRMSRTSKRAIVQGKVTAKAAFWFGLTLALIGTAILAVFVNWTTALCGVVGIVFYSYLYTVWFKRHTSLSTVFGGVAGAMPPLMGWAAGSGGTLDLAAWAVFWTFFLWQPPHFLPLAMKRSEEYRAAGIPMLPVVRGFQVTKWQIVRYTAAMLPISLMPFAFHRENIIYLIVMLILGLAFLARAVQGLFVREDLPWANKLFGFSLIYLTSMCVVMIVGAI